MEGILNLQKRSWLIIPGLLLAAVVFACLFSLLLPPSASLLAPTITPTPTVTNTPIATLTPTATITPLPAHLITPNVTEFPGYTVYWERSLWKNAAGEVSGLEDFEKDRSDYGELGFPYFTGNRFILTGTSAAQILSAPELLPSGNLIHFRDWEEGLTFTFPNDMTVTAFGFDYASNEDWRLSFNSIDIPIPNGRNRFLGVLLRQEPVKQFTFFGPPYAQGGLSVDNISYIP
jgi:hypothetical protein